MGIEYYVQRDSKNSRDWWRVFVQYADYANVNM